jgi:glutamine amidotransferase
VTQPSRPTTQRAPAAVHVVNVGISNVGSVLNMLRKLGVRAVVPERPADLKDAARIILPGVGHFATAMQRLGEAGYHEALDQAVRVQRTPVLGICLGMQLMTRHSEEGDVDGFGWVEASTVGFDRQRLGGRLPLPHMGWNEVRVARPCRVVSADETPRYYFVHSYHVVCDQPADATMWTHYGYPFVSGFEVGRCIGVQFHPEKSHHFGMRLLERFVRSSPDE